MRSAPTVYLLWTVGLGIACTALGCSGATQPSAPSETTTAPPASATGQAAPGSNQQTPTLAATAPIKPKQPSSVTMESPSQHSGALELASGTPVRVPMAARPLPLAEGQTAEQMRQDMANRTGAWSRPGLRGTPVAAATPANALERAPIRSRTTTAQASDTNTERMEREVVAAPDAQAQARPGMWTQQIRTQAPVVSPSGGATKDAATGAASDMAQVQAPAESTTPSMPSGLRPVAAVAAAVPKGRETPTPSDMDQANEPRAAMMITAGQLAQDYGQLTSQELLERYRGRMLEVTGRVERLINLGDEAGTELWLDGTDTTRIKARFSDRGALLHSLALSANAEMKLRCFPAGMRNGSVSLKDCEIMP